MTRLQVKGLTSRACSVIEGMIARGELKMGDRINESTLANTFGISRGPVREACRSLAERGLLTVVPNHGAFVRTISLEQVRKLYEVRAGISGYAGYVLVSRPQPGLIRQLEEQVQIMDAATENGDVDGYYSSNLEYHRAICEATDNDELSRTYNNLVAQLHLFRTQSLMTSGSQQQSNNEHRQIIEAIASGQPMIAFAALHDHVIAGMRRMLAARSREEQAEQHLKQPA